MDVVASLSQSRTAAAQCGLFTYKSVPVIFEPPCISEQKQRQSYCVGVREFESLQAQKNFLFSQISIIYLGTVQSQFKRHMFLPPEVKAAGT